MELIFGTSFGSSCWSSLDLNSEASLGFRLFKFKFRHSDSQVFNFKFEFYSFVTPPTLPASQEALT